MRILPPITITDAMITACNVAEADYAQYAAGTTYAVGTRVIVLVEHKIYESLQSANTGNTPASSPTWWLDIGATNRWNMFDSKVGTQTTNADSITITLTPGEVVDSLAFLDVDAAEISITMTDPVEGVVYTETLDLVAKGRIIDGYTYFFEPIILTDAAVLIGIPPYGSASIAITITNTGGTAAIGTLAIGINRSLGGTLQEPTVGIIDYSRKDVDTFGNYSITVRSYSKRMNCKVQLENSAADELERILANYRSTAIIWIAATQYSSLIIYGFYKNHNIVIETANGAVTYCDLEIEGLV